MRYLSIFLAFWALNLVAQENLGEIVVVGEDIITNVGGSQSAKKEDIEIRKKRMLKRF